MDFKLNRKQRMFLKARAKRKRKGVKTDGAGPKFHPRKSRPMTLDGRRHSKNRRRTAGRVELYRCGLLFITRAEIEFITRRTSTL